MASLCKICTAYETSFSTIQQYCVALNPYGVHVRYPNELTIDDKITKQAIDNAKKLLLFCETKIEKMIDTGS